MRQPSGRSAGSAKAPAAHGWQSRTAAPCSPGSAWPHDPAELPRRHSAASATAQKTRRFTARLFICIVIHSPTAGNQLNLSFSALSTKARRSRFRERAILRLRAAGAMNSFAPHEHSAIVPPRRIRSGTAPPPGTAAGTLHHGHLRRRRRPDQAPAGPGAVQPRRTDLLPEHFAIVGVDITAAAPTTGVTACTPCCRASSATPSSENRIDAIDQAAWQRLADAMSYVQGDFNDCDLFEKLRAHLHDMRSDRQTSGNCLFYLAVADRFFGPIVEHLGHAGLLRRGTA